jgi:hypothetical protein
MDPILTSVSVYSVWLEFDSIRGIISWVYLRNDVDGRRVPYLNIDDEDTRRDAISCAGVEIQSPGLWGHHPTQGDAVKPAHKGEPAWYIHSHCPLTSLRGYPHERCGRMTFDKWYGLYIVRLCMNVCTFIPWMKRKLLGCWGNRQSHAAILALQLQRCPFRSYKV